MRKNIRDLVKEWPKCFIQESDLAMLLNDKTDDARYALVKRVLKEGLLIRIRRGFYLIADKGKLPFIDEFELALLIYGPSFVSLESALSYHGWIPEAVYTTTCVTTKRAKEFKTPYGIFSYEHIPSEIFYTGVNRIESKNGVFFIASPWRAVADFIYTTRRSWKNISELEVDLRIDKEDLINSDKEMLKLLAVKYPSRIVRENLKRFLKEIVKILKVNK
ncbi:TPA: hypothetical protein DEO28_01670 [Candidatus Dependentiae bacterium]|nr:MAG: hypothetical protein UR14_C0004G0022 [candidate division TM6 bacterium GW2011_GWE2_31_21]KKP52940.1 MAG: hypothetical protein UR43_C0008G0022 [candidate division TM6 bacterium GW2011_GWF2_33_332]HBS47819.1 hypothetical protein [Candidatus Dependentiae bacterium]HBZ73205.1 hypothetical protein [Candidatus Dependentiae bacterium]